MTRNPAALQVLQSEFEGLIGDYWLGTVGDASHTYGYHLGGYEVSPDDYSIIETRDVNGIRQFGGFFASAVDVGMGWPAARDWLKWLISETNRGAFPDIREIIGSTDGETCWVWDRPTRSVVPQPANHIGHTHISFFRDSIFRNHAYLFTPWSATGVRVSNTGPGLGPRPVVSDPVAMAPDANIPGESSSTSLRGILLVGTLGAVAWVIKRRMEAGL